MENWLKHYFIVKSSRKYGFILGISIIIWISMEYVIGTIVNQPELGAGYGLLSEVILAVAFYVYLRNHATTKSFKTNFIQCVKFLLPASIIVLAFMLIYVPFINTNLHGLYDGSLSNGLSVVHSSIILGTFLGVILEGVVVALIICGVFGVNNSKSKMIGVQ